MMPRYVLAVFAAAAFACASLATSAAASAAPAPDCPNNTVVVQGKVVSPPDNAVCDDDVTGGGLLGNAPIVGNLPGLGGLL
jgi:type 1 fimbria pilin